MRLVPFFMPVFWHWLLTRLSLMTKVVFVILVPVKVDGYIESHQPMS
ncbi:hypothetical protein [Photobacterium leiognathi]|nr:hypothetical protein [Photobacterium leiognathi]